MVSLVSNLPSEDEIQSILFFSPRRQKGHFLACLHGQQYLNTKKYTKTLEEKKKV